MGADFRTSNCPGWTPTGACVAEDLKVHRAMEPAQVHDQGVPDPKLPTLSNGPESDERQEVRTIPPRDPYPQVSRASRSDSRSKQDRTPVIFLAGRLACFGCCDYRAAVIHLKLRVEKRAGSVEEHGPTIQW